MCCYVSLRRYFHPPSSIRCSICFCTSRMRHDWGGLCRIVSAIQSRDVRRFFERNVKINTKSKLPLQRHIFSRRCQTSQLNTMVRSFSACIIHPHVTILAIMNRVSTFSEDNLEVQVMRGTRPWTMRGILRKYSTLCPIHEFPFHKFPLLSIQPPLSFFWYREFQQLFWRRSRAPTPMEMESLLKNGSGNSQPDFIYWFQQKVVLNS